MLSRLILFRNHICNFSSMKPHISDQTIFDKIISKEIKSSTVYEDDKVYFTDKKDLRI